MKFKVVKYGTIDEFQEGVNDQFNLGYSLDSWNIDKDWGIVALYVRRPKK